MIWEERKKLLARGFKYVTKQLEIFHDLVTMDVGKDFSLNIETYFIYYSLFCYWIFFFISMVGFGSNQSESGEQEEELGKEENGIPEETQEQADEVEQALSGAGFVEVERRFDLASRPRVVAARKPMDETS